MTTIVGRNLKVEVALTFGTPVSPSAVTKADPGVVTATSHGLVDDDVGYWSATSGMVELDGQANRVEQTDANTFSLSGLETTNYSTFTAGPTFTKGATWGLLEEASSVVVGGGAAAQLDDSRLHLAKVRNIAGLNAPQDLTFSIKPPEVEGTALAFMQKAARAGTSVLIKVTKGTRIVRVAYGVPSMYDENVDVGGIASGGFNVVCPAYVLKPNV